MCVCVCVEVVKAVTEGSFYSEETICILSGIFVQGVVQIREGVHCIEGGGGRQKG